MNVDDMWFQQDDITRNNSIIARVISCNFPFWWSELARCVVGLFFLGFFEVYADKSMTILKKKIERCINEIQSYLRETIMENLNKKARASKVSWRPFT